MKFSTIVGTISLAFAATAVAAPTEVNADALVERAPVDSAYSVASGLYTQIKTYTGAINATSKSVSKSSSQQEKNAAAASVGKQISGITAAVKDATTKVKAIHASGASKRQVAAPGPADLAAIVENIILEISGALNGIIATLGLQPLLAFLTPLVASLSGLLLSLEAVVNNLLAIVQSLLDGLLTGLSLGLAGLVL